MPVLRYIAERDPDLIMRKGALGVSPGHLAAIHGHLDAVRFIASASPLALRARDRNGSTLAHYAAQHGHADIVAFAHAHRPDALADMNNAFETPTHLAATAGRTAALEFAAAFGRCTYGQDQEASEVVYVHCRAAGAADIFIVPISGKDLEEDIAWS